MVRECFNLDENADESEIKHVMASVYCNPKGEQNHIQQLDYKMKETLNRFNEKINRHDFVIFSLFPTSQNRILSFGFYFNASL